MSLVVYRAVALARAYFNAKTRHSDVKAACFGDPTADDVVVADERLDAAIKAHVESVGRLTDNEREEYYALCEAVGVSP